MNSANATTATSNIKPLPFTSPLLIPYPLIVVEPVSV
jgi:hypothetical protein